MYTVINRTPVPASDPSAFEEHFAASMNATLPGVEGLIGARLLRPAGNGQAYLTVMEFTSSQAFTDWMRSPAFAAAHGSTSHATPGVVESYETVAELRGDGRDA